MIEEKPKEAPKPPEVIPPPEEHKEKEAYSEKKPKTTPKEEESLFIPPKKILTKPEVKKKSATVVKVAPLTREIEDNIVIDHRTICKCARACRPALRERLFIGKIQKRHKRLSLTKMLCVFVTSIIINLKAQHRRKLLLLLLGQYM